MESIILILVSTALYFIVYWVDNKDVRLQIFLAATEALLATPAKNAGKKTEFYISSLLTGLGGVLTFEMNQSLRTLADLAEKDERVMQFLREANRLTFICMKLTYLQKESWKNYKQELKDTPFLEEFENLLDNHGFRAVNELEVASVRWAEDPSYLFEQLNTMVTLNVDSTPQEPADVKRYRKIIPQYFLY